MESTSSKDGGANGSGGDLGALGPLGMMRQSYVNATMSPTQLAASVDKMTAELKIYKEMAQFYQQQVSKLSQGNFNEVFQSTSSTGAHGLSTPSSGSGTPRISSLAHAKRVFGHSKNLSGSGEANFHFQLSPDDSELVLPDNKTVSIKELLVRCHRTYHESLTVISCGECIIPLPGQGLEEKFRMLCQPLVFHDKRAPEDCQEASESSSCSHTVITGEDTPLDVLLDLWEHSVVFAAGASTMGTHAQQQQGNSPNTTSQSSAASSPPSSPPSMSSTSSLNSPRNGYTNEAGVRIESLKSSNHMRTKPTQGPTSADNGTSSQFSNAYFSAAVVAPLISIMCSNAEKLMRVVVFQREAHTQEKYAERLVRALTGMSGQYRHINKVGAASSLLMIAHQIIATFPAVIPPVLSDRIYVLLLLGATTEHERREWLHMLNDQIHFTTTTLLCYNVGFIVSKLRTNPVVTPQVLEEISARLSELETLVPTLAVDVPLFQVWVKTLVSCFHAELGARCGDMERASLAMSRIEQLVRENYSSSLVVVLLSELRNFAQNCSPCSVLINGQQRVLCHYLIDKIQGIHDEMCQDETHASVHAPSHLQMGSQVSIPMTPLPTNPPAINPACKVHGDGVNIAPISSSSSAPQFGSIVPIVGGIEQPAGSLNISSIPEDASKNDCFSNDDRFYTEHNHSHLNRMAGSSASHLLNGSWHGGDQAMADEFYGSTEDDLEFMNYDS